MTSILPPMGRSNTRESKIANHLVATVEGRGGWIRKVHFESRVGSPDYVIGGLPDWPTGYVEWVETKAPRGGRMAPTQVQEHNRMRAGGQVVLVINTTALVDEHYSA